MTQSKHGRRTSRTDRNEALSLARLHGTTAAAKASGIASATLIRWAKEEGIEVSPDGPPKSVIAYGLNTGDDAAIVPGNPKVKDRDYIAQEMIGAAINGANLYTARRRAEARVQLVDCAMDVLEKLGKSESGRDAQSWAVAFGILWDKVRLESGSPSDVKGLRVVRQELDDKQAREYGGVDLSRPIGDQPAIETTAEAV